MRVTTGTFWKPVGSDDGVVFKQGKWKKFECLGCTYAYGILVERWQGPPSEAMSYEYLNGSYVYKHDIKLHKAWETAGKPTKRL